MKGVDELRGSQRPLQAADMVLVRLAYAADMPTPGEALRQLGYGGPGAAAPAASAPSGAPRGPVASLAPPAPRASASTAAAPRPAAAPAVSAPGVALASFEALVALAESRRDIRLKIALESEVRLVRFEQGRIEFELAPGGARDLASTLTQRLQLWTNERWMVSVVASGGAPTLKEQREATERERRSGLEADPVVASVLAHFPGAQIIAVRGRDETAPAPAADALEAPDMHDDDRSPFDDD
jgi:DNA polymerase III subunit gamma/tau